MSRLVNRTLIALRDSSANHYSVTLILAVKKQNQDSVSGRVLNHITSKQESNVVYELKEAKEFKRDLVLWSTQIQCTEGKDKSTVTILKQALKEKYDVIVNDDEEQIRHEKEQNNEQDGNQSDDGINKKKKGRSKAIKGRKQPYPQQSSGSEEDEQQQTNKRGRGRPKGSKGKRTQQATNSIRDVRNLLWRHLQSGDLDSPPQAKHISKQKSNVKIQPSAQQKDTMLDPTQKGKRSRGRPKGVKNKPKSEPENQQQSQQGFNHQLPLPMQNQVQSLSCCFRCQNRKTKQSYILNTATSYKKTLHSDSTIPSNLWFDMSMQNRSNVVIQSLKKNIDASSFQILVKKLSNYEPYFVCSWQYEGRIQKLSYTVKTNKNYLSQTGKEGNTALLHDCEVKSSEIWWKQIGIERILQAMTVNTDKKIINFLREYDPELKKAIQQNIPTLIRCGNHEIARYILDSIIPTNYSVYGYSKEHYECLNQKNSNIHFKKINILKQNFGNSFCSPIHCAAINPNPKLLENFLKSLHDYNVSDSLSRKPIHYAALAKTTGNLATLLNHKSDLKQTDKQRITPLMLAAMYGKAQNLSFILENANDSLYINFRCKDMLSALHYAIINQQLACVKILINHSLIDIELQGRDKLTSLHLAAGTGNIQIVKQLINAGHQIDSLDRFKRTPLFFAIRNNNHAVTYELLKNGAKYYKKDTSLNSLLHYCAAYGNTLFLQHLLPHMKINKNKQKYYPWQIAVGKGHIDCINLLEKWESKTIDGPRQHNMCFLNMRSIRYTPQSIKIMQYLIDHYYQPDEVDANGSRLLHILCLIGQQDYIHDRQLQTGKFEKQQEFRQEYIKLCQQLMIKLQQKQPSADVENKRGQTPITLCLQKQNKIGIKILLKDHLNLQFQSSRGYTLLHYFSELSSENADGINFVLQKLEDKKIQERNRLRDALKKTDINGFQAILFFIKDFTFKVKSNFDERVRVLRQSQDINPERTAFDQYCEHQKLMVKLLCLLVDLGCDANVLVQDKRRYDETQNFKRWGILHFLMKFPSPVLLQLFRNKIKIRDFNIANSNGMTPLHLFCQWIRYGCLFNVEFNFEHDYKGEKSLQFLLQNGCAPNNIDSNRSSPLSYAALNQQIEFIILLRRFSSSINNCNNCNQVPFIEIIKMKNHFTFSSIQTLLQIGADPNCEDLNKQTALHHLVHNSINLDNSTQLCKLFFSFGAKINSLDKYQRTPLFYCFAKIDGEEIEQPTHDKIQILQALLNQKEIDINHKDVFQKTALHYACQKNYFFSILYLLDKNIDISVKDYEGNTPLAVCLKHKRLNQAALLIKRGVSEGQVVDGQITLSYFAYAITKLSVGICYMLLDYGYPIDKALQQVPNQQFKSLLQKKYGKKK